MTVGWTARIMLILVLYEKTLMKQMLWLLIEPSPYLGCCQIFHRLGKSLSDVLLHFPSFPCLIAEHRDIHDAIHRAPILIPNTPMIP